MNWIEDSKKVRNEWEINERELKWANKNSNHLQFRERQLQFSQKTIAIRTVNWPLAGETYHPIQHSTHTKMRNIFVYVQRNDTSKTVHNLVIYDQLHGHFIANTRTHRHNAFDIHI